MAIIPSCPGVEVEVIVNRSRQPLHEYEDNNSNTPPPPNTITKYIEAKSGAEFAIHLLFTYGYRYPVGHIEELIKLDGEPVESYIIIPADFFHLFKHFVDGQCAQVGDYVVLQKFRFNQLSIGKSRHLASRETLSLCTQNE